jgi:AraC-like DNA-binding protein
MSTSLSAVLLVWPLPGGRRHILVVQGVSATFYGEYAGDARHAGRVACVWAQQAGGEPHVQRVVPDGCVDVLLFGADLQVAGPDTRAMLARLAAGTRITGVRFRPGQAPGVLGLPLDALRDQRVPMGELWGDAAARIGAEVAAAVTAEDSARRAGAWPDEGSVRGVGPESAEEAVRPAGPGPDEGPVRSARQGADDGSVRGAGQGAAEGSVRGVGPESAEEAVRRAGAGSDEGAVRGAAAGFGGLGAGAARLLERLVLAYGDGPADPAVAATARALCPGGGLPGVAGVAGVADGFPRVAGVADELGLSERQLRRRCLTAFGYGPKTLQRVVRFQRALRAAREPGAEIAGVAYRFGYADQAHLSRDVRALAGVPLTSLI